MNQPSKTLATLLRSVGIGASAITALSGSLLSTDASAGISNTRHNLGTTGTVNSGQNQVTSGTGEICVFCHTPHASATGTDLPPLWNKALTGATGAAFTTYASTGSATLEAKSTSGNTTTGSTSMACLSCHDGSQAMDSMINSPGSGLQGNNVNTGANYTWTGGGVNAQGFMTNVATTLGKDLTNDHPIGIAYCGGMTTVQSGSVSTCADKDFNVLSVQSGTYYLETTTVTGRDKSDITLYNRTMGSASQPSVECGSCHDPHVEAKSTNQVAFLRVSQSGSGVCLACHAK